MENEIIANPAFNLVGVEVKAELGKISSPCPPNIFHANKMIGPAILFIEIYLQILDEISFLKKKCKCYVPTITWWCLFH